MTDLNSSASINLDAAYLAPTASQPPASQPPAPAAAAPSEQTAAAAPAPDHGADAAATPAPAARAQSPASSASPQSAQAHATGTNGGRRAHRRTYQSMINGGKIPHLKKKDGEALWRADIQYDLLYAIFTDATPAFTNTYRGGARQTFADVYLDAMAHSSKCSKVLSEKLVGDRPAGIRIAMVCLLVNLGRVNTTLNFFPEMKALLRTYHPIPSLQTHDTADYKQLQDAPRLKSILKGACETSGEPTTLETLRQSATVPPTNPINLIFLMSAFPQQVEKQFIHHPEFSLFDLVMDTTKSSKSRARAFLWLIWAYLESGSSASQAKNPFGHEFPLPEPLSSAEVSMENIDTPAEIMFGNQMTLQRLSILDSPSNSAEDSPSSSGSPAAELAGASQEDAGATIDTPLAVPKPRLRSAKDRRVFEEFNALVREKRSARKRRRLARNNALRDTWLRIKDLDPVYDTDDDFGSVKQKGRNHTPGPGVQAAGLADRHGDYGERTMALAVSLKRAAKKATALLQDASVNPKHEPH